MPTRGAGRLPGSEDGLSICVLNGTRRPPSLPLPPSYPSRRRPAEPTRHARSSIRMHGTPETVGALARGLGVPPAARTAFNAAAAPSVPTTLVVES